MTSMTTNGKKRITLFVNPNIAKHAKAQAVVEGTSLTSLVEKSLTGYLPKITLIRKSEIEVY